MNRSVFILCRCMQTGNRMHTLRIASKIEIGFSRLKYAFDPLWASKLPFVSFSIHKCTFAIYVAVSGKSILSRLNDGESLNLCELKNALRISTMALKREIIG